MDAFEPLSMEGLDCAINSYISIIHHAIREYHYVFWDSWQFYYNPDKERWGDRIHFPMRAYKKNLACFYGLKLMELPSAEKEEFFMLAEKKLAEGIPVILTMDTYYCSWYENYGISHGEHTFILIGYENGIFECVDSLPKKIGVWLTKEQIRCGMSKAEYILYKKNVKTRSFDDFLRYTLERRCEENEGQNLIQFAKSFHDAKLSEEIEFDSLVWESQLLKSIRRIYQSRKHFLLFLEYLAQTDEEREKLECITEILSPIISEWGTMMNLLYKIHVSKSLKKEDKIKALFSRISSMEEEAGQKINYLVEHGGLAEQGSHLKTKAVMLKLEYTECSHMITDDAFSRETNIFDIETWSKDTFGIDFTKHFHKAKNCSPCMGQKLCLPEGKIVRLHFVGYGVWEDQLSEYSVHYADGSVTSEMGISDWCGEGRFGERIIWKGVFRQHENNNVPYNGFIFDVRLHVDSKRRAVEVELPNCPRIICVAVIAEMQCVEQEEKNEK